MAVITIGTVKICNMALSHIGARSSIESIGENSAEARTCKLWYDPSRVEALESHDWTFARKTLALALHSDAADLVDWQYRYQRPADAIKLRSIINPLGLKADRVPYRVEMSDDGSEETIVTNLEDASVRYTFNQANESLFSLTFTEALAFLLASKIAPALTGKRELAQEMLQAYFAISRLAAAQDGNEEADDKPREAEWMRVYG